MSTILSFLFGASWRTSLIGLVGAILELVFAQMHAGHIDARALAMAAWALILGRLAKDHVVTGGTVAATSEAERRIP